MSLSGRFALLSADKSDVERSEIDHRQQRQPSRCDSKSPVVQSRKVTRSISQEVIIESDCDCDDDDDNNNKSSSNKKGGRNSKNSLAAAKRGVKESVLSGISKNLVEKTIEGKRKLKISSNNISNNNNNREQGNTGSAGHRTVSIISAPGLEGVPKPQTTRGTLRNDSVIIDESDDEPPPPPYSDGGSGSSQPAPRESNRRERGGRDKEKKKKDATRSDDTNNRNSSGSGNRNVNCSNNNISSGHNNNGSAPSTDSRGPGSNGGDKTWPGRHPSEKEGSRRRDHLPQNTRAMDMLAPPSALPRPPSDIRDRHPADINAPPNRTHNSSSGAGRGGGGGSSVFSRIESSQDRGRESRGGDKTGPPVRARDKPADSATLPAPAAPPAKSAPVAPPAKSAPVAPPAKSAPVAKAAAEEPPRQTFVVEQVTAFSAPAQTTVSSRGWADSDDDE